MNPKTNGRVGSLFVMLFVAFIPDRYRIVTLAILCTLFGIDEIFCHDLNKEEKLKAGKVTWYRRTLQIRYFTLAIAATACQVIVFGGLLEYGTALRIMFVLLLIIVLSTQLLIETFKKRKHSDVDDCENHE